MTITAYHFLSGDKLRDGRTAPPDGVWLQHNGPITICESGLHASRHPFYALRYAPGNTLCLVECEEIVEEDDDKLVCRRRRIVARLDATDLLLEFARWCALQAVDNWDCPPVVCEWLTTGDESLRDAAWHAAWTAAWAAAWHAAWAATDSAAWAAADSAAESAAWAAAWYAAKSAQREKFQQMVDGAFKDMAVRND